MAPQNGAAKPRQTNESAAAATNGASKKAPGPKMTARPVIQPALPLPLLRRKEASKYAQQEPKVNGSIKAVVKEAPTPTVVSQPPTPSTTDESPPVLAGARPNGTSLSAGSPQPSDRDTAPFTPPESVAPTPSHSADHHARPGFAPHFPEPNVAQRHYTHRPGPSLPGFFPEPSGPHARDEYGHPYPPAPPMGPDMWDRMRMPPPYPPMISGASAAASDEEATDGLVDFMKGQFMNSESADCVLELRSKLGWASHIVAHRFVLGRSPVLRSLPVSEYRIPPNESLPVLTLHTDDKSVTPESFYLTIQRLYGFPLFDVPRQLSGGDKLVHAGSDVDRFDFALSYAASGQLIEWPPIINKGMGTAMGLVDFNTIEKALDFALKGTPAMGSMGSLVDAPNGVIARGLLLRVEAVMLHNLPPDFILDKTSYAPVGYSRLPNSLDIAPPEQTGPQSEGPPIVAVGRKLEQLMNGKSRRRMVPNIRFGDMGASNGDESELSSPAMSPHTLERIGPLSRVFLNIPFLFLRNLLQEIIKGERVSWVGAEARCQLVKEVIEAREERRRRGVEAVLAGRVPNAKDVERNLASPEPRFLDDFDVLGWQEQIVSLDPLNPAVDRVWVPLPGRANGSEAKAFP